MPRRKSVPNSSATATTDKLSTPTSRQSSRLKSSPLAATGISSKTPTAKPTNGTKKTTPKKSQYFSAGEEDSPSEASSFENEESGYEDEDPSVSVISSPPASSDEAASPEPFSEDENPKKRKRVVVKEKANKRVAVKVNKEGVAVGDKGQELWRPGVKSKLAPGEAVFVPLPKARGDGGVRYEDGRVHPNTMLFLGDLKKNNDREWLKVHDADYRQSKKNFDSFVESLTPQIAEKDETVPELPPKDLTFRIYRDIRFSHDPTPYKTHFSAAWSRTGRKGPYAGYYLQISPSRSFIGAGIWHPEAAPLALLRRDIDRHPERLKEALKSEGIVDEFLGLGAEKKGKRKEKGTEEMHKECVKKFVGMNQENALKTKPRDYAADHRDIALLRLRNYTIGRKLRDEEVVGQGGLERALELMGCLVPFVTYLNSVVMPDDPASSSSDDSGHSGAEDNVEEASGSESDVEDEA